MTDVDTVKARLRRLATNSDGPSRPAHEPIDYAETIERATVALDDVGAAAAFAEDTGIKRLERAVETAERSVSATAGQGRETLAEYRRFRAVATGDHFHRGHGTSLGDDDEAGSR